MDPPVSSLRAIPVALVPPHPLISTANPALAAWGNLVGTSISHDKVLGKIGEGGMGEVSLDGQRFLMIQREQELVPTEIFVVLNGLEELKRLVPTHSDASSTRWKSGH